MNPLRSLFHVRALAAALLLAVTPTVLAAGRWELRVARQGWGDGDPEMARLVLESAAAQVEPIFAELPLPVIEIKARGGPITCYDLADDGAVRVALDTGDEYWAQYVYQFSHELGHVLSHGPESYAGTQFVEEILCQALAFYTLERVAYAWEKSPREPWVRFAPSMRGYLRGMLEKATLPEGETAAAYFASRREHLASHEDDWPVINRLSAALLPEIRRDPRLLVALWHLRDTQPAEPHTVEQLLSRWRDNTPAEHRGLVLLFAERFGLRPAPSATRR